MPQPGVRGSVGGQALALGNPTLMAQLGVDLAPLAAGLLFPFTGWLLSPMIAALAMRLSSASMISNAPRLRQAVLIQN